MRRRLIVVVTVAAMLLVWGAAAAQAAWWPVHSEADRGMSGSTRRYGSITSPALGEGFIIFDCTDQGRDIYLEAIDGSSGLVVPKPAGYDQAIGPASIDGTRQVYVVRQSDGGRTDIVLWDRQDPAVTRLLSNDAGIDAYPVVSGDHVAWLKANDGDLDVWLYDLRTGTGGFLAPGYSGNTDLAFDDDHLAWAAWSGDNYDIVVHHLESDSTRQITFSGGDERYPALDDEMIAYSIKSNIVDFDLQMHPVDGAIGDGKYISWAVGDQTHPAISGDIITWQDNRSGDWDIRAVAYSDPNPNGNSQLIDGGARDQTAPAIHGSSLAWVTQYDDALHTTVMLFDLSGPTRMEAVFPSTAPGYDQATQVTVNLFNGVGDKLVKRGTLFSSSTQDGPWTSLGAFTFGSPVTVRATARTYYRAVFAGDVFNDAHTEVLVESLLPKSYLSKPRVSTTAVRASRSYTWSGDLKPRHAAGAKTVRLEFYRKQGGQWVLRKTADAVNYNYSSYSRFTVKTSLPAKGSWRVRAYAPSDSGHAATAGSWKYFTVR